MSHTNRVPPLARCIGIVFAFAVAVACEGTTDETACSTSDPCAPGFTCSEVGCIEGCTQAADCPQGTDCVFRWSDDGLGSCVDPCPPGGGCMWYAGENSESLCDCLSGSSCQGPYEDGTLWSCTAEGVFPCTDEGCGANAQCIAGRCRATCALDGECQAGEVCVGGFCADPPQPCTDSFDCPVDQICDGAACVAAAPECVEDADCAADSICLRVQGFAWQCTPGCRDQNGCTAGQACILGECMPSTEVAVCPEGSTLRPDNAGCTCPAGQGWDGVGCVAGCQSHLDCAAQDSCVFDASLSEIAFCMAGCVADWQCPETETCIIWQSGDPTGSCRADCAEGASCAREDSVSGDIAEVHCPCPSGLLCGARDDAGNLYCEAL